MKGRILALGAALVVAAVLAHITAPRLETEAHYKPSEFEEAKESIALSLMGQLRMSVGDLMWLKTLEYLHNGIIYRPPTKKEEGEGVRAVEFTGMGAGVAHSDGPSLVPDAERDWRGILGNVNREVEPYRSGAARHSDPQELIPWYQLLTKFNPNYVQAYTVGALFMSDFAREPGKARDFLKAGAEANPWSFEIQSALGRLYFDYFKQYQEAADALQQAVELAGKEKQYLAERDDELDEPQTQLLNEAYLFLARSYTELGRYEEALSVCAEGAEELNYPLLRVQERIIKKHMDEVKKQTGSSS
jgi:tetratricopeptide (TPR) repeat protein